MKRTLSAVSLCFGLLVIASVFLGYSTSASEPDAIDFLLNLPAPPPPNPAVTLSGGIRAPEFYDPKRPPAENAPIDDLLDYWERQYLSATTNELAFFPKPSPRVMARLLGEARKDHDTAFRMMNVFRNDAEGTRIVSDAYDAAIRSGESDPDDLLQVRNWLTYNSSRFIDELEAKAARYGPTGEYVRNHWEMLALARQDWERAKPIVERAYMDTNGVVRVGAAWALYRNALSGSSISDADRYRDELKAVVEDRNATPAMRDLALDALVGEAEWPGRDEWYFSLLGDETLADLRINGSTYTGLSTIIQVSPPDKYRDRMIELVAGGDKTTRNAAARNLLVSLRYERNEEAIRALLPWLTDPDWVNIPENDGRGEVVRALTELKVPDSVPGLIHLLNEQKRQSSGGIMGTATMAANTVANSARTTSSAANVNAVNPAVADDDEDYDRFPFRYSALAALVKQADARAIPALRRLLNTTEDWEQGTVLRALYASGGFTIEEQVTGIEAAARNAELLDLPVSSFHSANTNASAGSFSVPPELSGESGLRVMLGLHLSQMESVSEELVRAVVDRVGTLRRPEPKVASAMQQLTLGWKGPAIYSFHLRDLKNGIADGNEILKLLGERAVIREQQPSDIYDLRSGSAMGIGIAGCLLEDTNEMASLLSGDNRVAVTAMLACARLLRLPLSVSQVAPLLKSSDKRLAEAAERYLESEDSKEARTAIYALYPNSARITGATTLFASKPVGNPWTDALNRVFSSVSPYYASSYYASSAAAAEDFSSVEEKLRKEVLDDEKLLGVYNYGAYYLRIYADRITFAVQEDASRYRERAITQEEFDHLRNYLTRYRVDELPPFLACPIGCESRQLLMLGRQGGRRVFVKANRMPEFFKGLDQYFAQLAEGKLSLKYEASKELPGLEVLYANEGLSVETVWKKGDDIRIFVMNRSVRERVDKEIENELAKMTSAIEEDDKPDEPSDDAPTPWQIRTEMIRKRQFEGLGWFGFADSGLTSSVAAPTDVGLPPFRDTLSVPARFERWKSVAGALEIRADEEGLYRVQAGRITKIKSGHYEEPVISENGRWTVVTKYNQYYSPTLVRLNLQTGREYAIDLGEDSEKMPIVYIPTVNRFLLGDLDYSSPDHINEYGPESGPRIHRPRYSDLPVNQAHQNAARSQIALRPRRDHNSLSSGAVVPPANRLSNLGQGTS
ncbi:HEAT repeat domain-containing protein [Leptolyngbya sp. 7M]|uniref:HEAT repeat domain-containing protein n=1 Tax=Leptolyngbya sp. 7M TaxID=2812896 RepID=UPI001B8ADF0F|nr:HEAT repeat domain-containing protein [Leptolyngbya sp. 7M]QYO67637.1 hypothetical protein JVX88_13100 [Leptolyngbya sp. 7M]